MSKEHRRTTTAIHNAFQNNSNAELFLSTGFSPEKREAK